VTARYGVSVDPAPRQRGDGDQLRNGKSVRVRINDLGPAKWTHRAIDVSLGAARALRMIGAGVVPVSIE
jgi:rare lipoprotein A